MGFTLHWTLEWILISANCGTNSTKFIREDHMAKQLTKTMNHMLAHCKLNAAQIAITTTNNGSNIKKACQDNKCPPFWP